MDPLVVLACVVGIGFLAFIAWLFSIQQSVNEIDNYAQFYEGENRRLQSRISSKVPNGNVRRFVIGPYETSVLTRDLLQRIVSIGKILDNPFIGQKIEISGTIVSGRENILNGQTYMFVGIDLSGHTSHVAHRTFECIALDPIELNLKVKVPFIVTEISELRDLSETGKNCTLTLDVNKSSPYYLSRSNSTRISQEQTSETYYLCNFVVESDTLNTHLLPED